MFINFEDKLSLIGYQDYKAAHFTQVVGLAG